MKTWRECSASLVSLSLQSVSGVPTVHSGLCRSVCSPSPIITWCEWCSSCSQSALVSVGLPAHLLLWILLIPPHSTHASLLTSLEDLMSTPWCVYHVVHWTLSHLPSSSAVFTVLRLSSEKNFQDQALEFVPRACLILWYHSEAFF